MLYLLVFYVQVSTIKPENFNAWKTFLENSIFKCPLEISIFSNFSPTHPLRPPCFSRCCSFWHFLLKVHPRDRHFEKTPTGYTDNVVTKTVLKTVRELALVIKTLVEHITYFVECARTYTGQSLVHITPLHTIWLLSDFRQPPGHLQPNHQNAVQRHCWVKIIF